ncbi:type II toxin-antitoxin system HipA family toxin [Candidatus Symbiopectobacterium sp. NZEC127]|uniref:type II toxin-antitoxin system HipA family toxin n=1 Tax=Candidatus Symbiopectobacterium sp. NZEC127 TaxID=2820472 RepID=UPI0022277CB5|nr:type II toxin-antitoxin system HipA family toxin [Candidatus Symbiopectobacterium sp. NZEC127]MCW2488650.1 type II toxin-antitoxin system HipA family toxin [Candidatus Symbiopectobacterium sp. NZEC127]
MTIDLNVLSQSIKHIRVNTPIGYSGRLSFDKGSYHFSYDADNAPNISITMSATQKMIYNSGKLFPIFEMNIPEGFVRRHISERLQRYAGTVTDMLFLALQQDTGIGALSYDSGIHLPKPSPENLNDLLKWDLKESAFNYLLNKYLLQTSVSGVQPKVMFSAENKGAILYPNLIAKTGDQEFPRLAENEFICMSLAKCCGLPAPNFYLSENKELFVMERFDIQHQQRIAMEDFCVLSGKSNEQKYISSYETGAKIVSHFTQDHSQVERYWRYVVFSCMVGNGDAHLKNFSLLYNSIETPELTLSPLYDVVSTNMYPTLEKKLALKLNKSNEFPNRDALIKFARDLKIIKPEHAIDEIADIINQKLNEGDLFYTYPELKKSISESLSKSNSTNNVFVKIDKKRTKKRKSDQYV